MDDENNLNKVLPTDAELQPVNAVRKDRWLRATLFGLAFLALGVGIFSTFPRGEDSAYQAQTLNCEDTLVVEDAEVVPLLTPRTLDEARSRFVATVDIDVRLEDIGGQQFDVLKAEDGALLGKSPLTLAVLGGQPSVWRSVASIPNCSEIATDVLEVGVPGVNFAA